MIRRRAARARGRRLASAARLQLPAPRRVSCCAGACPAEGSERRRGAAGVGDSAGPGSAEARPRQCVPTRYVIGRLEHTPRRCPVLGGGGGRVYEAAGIERRGEEAALGEQILEGVPGDAGQWAAAELASRVSRDDNAQFLENGFARVPRNFGFILRGAPWRPLAVNRRRDGVRGRERRSGAQMRAGRRRAGEEPSRDTSLACMFILGAFSLRLARARRVALFQGSTLRTAASYVSDLERSSREVCDGPMRMLYPSQGMVGRVPVS